MDNQLWLKPSESTILAKKMIVNPQVVRLLLQQSGLDSPLTSYCELIQTKLYSNILFLLKNTQNKLLILVTALFKLLMNYITKTLQGRCITKMRFMSLCALRPALWSTDMKTAVNKTGKDHPSYSTFKDMMPSVNVTPPNFLPIIQKYHY